MRLSVEVVPRGRDVLIEEIKMIKNNFPSVDSINIPDLLKFDLRSWEACKYGRDIFNNIIPHIRAIDINLKPELEIKEFLEKNNVHEILVVEGEPPHDMSRLTYPTNSIDVIRKFKAELPNVKVYAAIDQYRSSLKGELEYIKRKIDAGADGFFTQPFFDLRFIEIYLELVRGKDVFFGISPVTSERSKAYWLNKNNVVFPTDFEPSFEWNVNFAKKVLNFAQHMDINVYLMPIKINLHKYLQGVFVQEN